jgi:spore germination protein KB
MYMNTRLADATLRGWRAVGARWLGYVRAPFYLLGAGFMLNIWLNALSTIDLPATPRIVLALASMAPALWTLRLGVELVNRIAGFIGLLMIPGLLLIVISTLPDVRWGEFLPSPLSLGVPASTWPAILFAPRGYVVIPTLAPNVRGPYHRAAFLGVLAGGIYLLLALVEAPLVFGVPVAAQMAYPFLRAIATISNPYLPIQRVAFLSSILWQMIVFTIIITYAISALQDLRVRIHPLVPWGWVFVAGAGVVWISLVAWPEDIMLSLFSLWSLWGIGFFLIAPALLLVGRRSA